MMEHEKRLDLIDRQALGICRCDPDVFLLQNRGYCAGWNGVINIIEQAPRVDAVEVVHGRWEYWVDNLARCSVCGYEYLDYLECDNYCGNCGAKMDGGNEDV